MISLKDCRRRIDVQVEGFGIHLQSALRKMNGEKIYRYHEEPLEKGGKLSLEDLGKRYHSALQ